MARQVTVVLPNLVPPPGCLDGFESEPAISFWIATISSGLSVADSKRPISRIRWTSCMVMVVFSGAGSFTNTNLNIGTTGRIYHLPESYSEAIRLCLVELAFNFSFWGFKDCSMGKIFLIEHLQ